MGRCGKCREPVTEVSLLSYQEWLAVERSFYSFNCCPTALQGSAHQGHQRSLKETVPMTILSCQGAPKMRPVKYFVLHIERLFIKAVLLQQTKMPEWMT